ncbi:hypothetical protein M405DRAFT_137629 [Rhizopogon salebrosus TDB-379]|nr:hypothetical protein M405DRAFT_137629 [Rhizopogon salebrosus TDB-379]
MHAKDRSSKNPPASFSHPPPASSLKLASETTSLHYLRHPSHEAAFLCHLVLLQRLKARFPAARGSSGHRLFVFAFMLA